MIGDKKGVMWQVVLLGIIGLAVAAIVLWAFYSGTGAVRDRANTVVPSLQDTKFVGCQGTLAIGGPGVCNDFVDIGDEYYVNCNYDPIKSALITADHAEELDFSACASETGTSQDFDAISFCNSLNDKSDGVTINGGKFDENCQFVSSDRSSTPIEVSSDAAEPVEVDGP